MNITHMKRNSSFSVKVNVSLRGPREGSRRLRLAGLLEKRHMELARLLALGVGRIYPQERSADIYFC